MSEYNYFRISVNGEMCGSLFNKHKKQLLDRFGIKFNNWCDYRHDGGTLGVFTEYSKEFPNILFMLEVGISDWLEIQHYDPGWELVYIINGSCARFMCEEKTGLIPLFDESMLQPFSCGLVGRLPNYLNVEYVVF